MQVIAQPGQTGEPGVTALRLERPATPAFATVVLGVDSTICTIDGIQWLAAQRGDIIARRVATLTAQARSGAIPFEQAYAERLAIIRPRRNEVDALARAYTDSLAPECADTLTSLRRAGVRIVLVSSGLRHALYRLAYHLGIDTHDVHAVDVRFDAVGAYTGYNHTSPLANAFGKSVVLSRLNVDRPLLAVGEDASDVSMRDSADAFVSFASHAPCGTPARQTDGAVRSFAELGSLVLS